MKEKYKRYAKLNFMSLFFFAVSLISVTLAWFAYSGIGKVSTEIGVKAWYIEFQKDNKAVSNNIVINLSDISPGMDTVSEMVNIKNLGDSNAQISYEITSARILNQTLDSKTLSSEAIEDTISHDYPMHINMNLSKNYAKATDGESTFEVSVSWPLDSDNDTVDSNWGKEAYNFIKTEKEKASSDANYQPKTPIEVTITIKAEQYMDTPTSIDPDYQLGDIVLYDVINNKKCTALSESCLKTYVIDKNNKVGDTSVNLMPDLFKTYQQGTYNNYNNLLQNIISNWSVTTRSLTAGDLLNIISTDIKNSYINREGFSKEVIGNLNYPNRINTELNNVINTNSYYTFLNEKFPFLTTSKCYWTNTEYDTNNAFALVKIDNTTSKIYKEVKTNNCTVAPVIVAAKSNLK